MGWKQKEHWTYTEDGLKGRATVWIDSDGIINWKATCPGRHSESGYSCRHGIDPEALLKVMNYAIENLRHLNKMTPKQSRAEQGIFDDE
jgi:hypothetical protein